MLHARSDYDRIQDPAGLIPKDEPVFLLRGQDVLAPELLETWAYQYQILGGDSEVIVKLQAHANRMRKWQEDVKSKTPDIPEGVMR